MRTAMLAMLALLAVAAATMAGSGPAAAIDYPYCIQGGGWGIPGDCSYRSYAECLASASGRRVYCNVNPRFAFGQQPGRGRIAITEIGFQTSGNSTGICRPRQLLPPSIS
jgi:hypothetical protein